MCSHFTVLGKCNVTNYIFVKTILPPPKFSVHLPNNIWIQNLLLPDFYRTTATINVSFPIKTKTNKYLICRLFDLRFYSRKFSVFTYYLEWLGDQTRGQKVIKRPVRLILTFSSRTKTKERYSFQYDFHFTTKIQHVKSLNSLAINSNYVGPSNLTPK